MRQQKERAALPLPPEGRGIRTARWMMDDERRIKRMRLKGLAERVDRWIWDKRVLCGCDNLTAVTMGLEVETVRSVRRMFERRGSR